MKLHGTLNNFLTDVIIQERSSCGRFKPFKAEKRFILETFDQWIQENYCEKKGEENCEEKAIFMFTTM